MLRPTQPEGQLIGGKLGSRSARLEHSAEGNQGRLASVCAELLPALPAGRAPGRDDRHVDRPYRLSLHRWLDPEKRNGRRRRRCPGCRTFSARHHVEGPHRGLLVALDYATAWL